MFISLYVYIYIHIYVFIYSVIYVHMYVTKVYIYKYTHDMCIYKYIQTYLDCQWYLLTCIYKYIYEDTLTVCPLWRVWSTARNFLLTRTSFIDKLFCPWKYLWYLEYFEHLLGSENQNGWWFSTHATHLIWLRNRKLIFGYL